MPKKEWHTRRVVVEVPVLSEAYSEKDLRWDIARLVEGAKLSARIHPATFGRVQVKEFSRVVRSMGR